MDGSPVAADAAAKSDERTAFEVWKNDPRFYDWNTNEQHAELNFMAGWKARATAPQATEIPATLKRDVLRLMHLATIGGPRAPNDGGEYNRLVETIRSALGE